MSRESWRSPIASLQVGAGPSTAAPWAVPTGAVPTGSFPTRAPSPQLQAPRDPGLPARGLPNRRPARRSSPWLWTSGRAATHRQSDLGRKLRRLPATAGKSRAKYRRSSRDSAGLRPWQRRERVPSNEQGPGPEAREPGGPARSWASATRASPRSPKRVPLRDALCRSPLQAPGRRG